MAIKRGVSFYSYQNLYYTGKMTLEQLIEATANQVGAEGIEILPEMTPVGSYPNPTDADIDTWFSWMDKYGTRPVCMDSFIDTMLFPGRTLTREEQVGMMERDLKLASRLGIPCIRVLCPVRKEIIESSLPIAEHYGVKMGLEIHSPMTIRSLWIDEYMEMVQKSGSQFAGLIMDFGIFAMRPPKRMLDNALKQGADPKILDRIVTLCEAHEPEAALIDAVVSMGGGAAELVVANSWERNAFSPPEWLRDYPEYIIHCHGKFNDMDGNDQETGIDYATPIKILKETGYDGYICSEFEGRALYLGDDEPDEIEQVRRQHVMLKNLLGE